MFVLCFTIKRFHYSVLILKCKSMTLHSTKAREEKYKFYPDLNKWWRMPGTCSDPGWRVVDQVNREGEEQDKAKINQQ